MARKKKNKLDFANMEPLKQNPFAALGRQFSVGAGPAVQEPSQSEVQPVAQERARLLIRMEKRKHGRLATCIYHLDRDAGAVLKKLKQRLGTGGAITENAVELQGDHREKVKAFLEGEGYKVRLG